MTLIKFYVFFQANITVKCGSKYSEPRSLTLKPAQPVVKLNGMVSGTTNR